MGNKMRKSVTKNILLMVLIMGMLLTLAIGCSSKNSSASLKGEWKITKVEKKSDSGYATAYKSIFSVGDTIRFVDGKTVQMGLFPFEYEIKEDNVIKLIRQGTTSIIFDFELQGKDTLTFENKYIRIKSSKEK